MDPAISYISSTYNSFANFIHKEDLTGSKLTEKRILFEVRQYSKKRDEKLAQKINEMNAQFKSIENHTDELK